MLPSTGYFKGISCPFYDNGLCVRPYCHFRHVKKESSAQNDDEEGGANLVSATANQAFQDPGPFGATEDDDDAEAFVVNTVHCPPKVTYNPTPISELRKRIDAESLADDDAEQKRVHIPVSYTSRKPGGIAVKRPLENNDSSESNALYPPRQFDYSDSIEPEPYLPVGSVSSTETYSPGSGRAVQEYIPNRKRSSDKPNYIADQRAIRKKLLEYDPTKVTPKPGCTVKYRPTPKSQVPCFSSDDDDDEPETKKAKSTNDSNGLDDLGPEFDILGQILDEESTIKTATNEQLTPKDGRLDKNLSKQHENSKKNEKFTSNIEHQAMAEKKKVDKKEKKSSSHSDEKYSDKSLKKAKSDEKAKTKHDKKDHKTAYREKTEKIPHKKNNHSSKHKSKSSDKDSGSHSKHSSSSKSRKSESSRAHKDSPSSHNSNNSKKEHTKNSKRESKVKHTRETDIKEVDTKKSKRESKAKHTKETEMEPVYNLSDSDNILSDGEGPANEELCISSESDEETRAMECMKIFEEYVPTAKPKMNALETEDVTNDNGEAQYIPGKIRISRTSNIKLQQKVPIKPDYKVNAAQAMSERLSKVREYHASRNIQSPDTNKPISRPDASKSGLIPPNTNHSKIRIAHVPYASTLVSAKKSIAPVTDVKNDQPSTSSTITQTVKKGTQRTAHVPNERFIDRPGVLEPLASKIPANIRSIYLNMMIDECLKIYICPTDAYARAQHEELTTSKKCSKVPIYKNSAVLTVTRLRKELQECKGIKKSGLDCSALQRFPLTATGNQNSTGSWSIENKNRAVVDTSKEFRGVQFYKNISKWILTKEQLQENGFPMAHPSREKGRAIICGKNKYKPPKGFIRTCCRCKKEYVVDKKGFPAVTQECIYHFNNKYRFRGEVKYQCCSQDGTSDGCCVAPCHVFEYVDYENLKGYVTTLPLEREIDDYGVFALDCEMCYTTQGLDLTRVTVIDSNCKVVYETLIKPMHPILDYNTRFSGITEEQMANVKTTLIEVQATLLTMFNSKTILIGHSLESDFKALKLIHGTVIDTSVLFPHKMGAPFKRALRNLSSEYLKKIIQNSVDGHDSAEDATVCMELIIYKLKEDLKTR